jgi:chromosome segregation ATPase
MNNSYEIVVSLSRERLARAVSKLDRLARDAAETIANLRQEKHDVEIRLADVTRMFAQERSNFEQRAALLQSVTSEADERKKSFDELNARLIDQERLLSEQLETIQRLESELGDESVQLRERQSIEQAWQSEAQEWKQKIEQLETRLKETAAERDTMKSELYERERENAHYAVRLSREDRDKAAQVIDTLLNQLSHIESRIATTAS